jgi:hypothetical protein
MPHIDLSEDEAAALVALLTRTIDGDRYPLSPRIRTLKAILAKLRPQPVREPYRSRRSTRRREQRPPEGVVPVEGLPRPADDAGRAAAAGMRLIGARRHPSRPI